MNEELYGCYRCGTINGNLRDMELDGRQKCGECGEDAIITFQEAMDALNDAYLKGIFRPNNYVDPYLELIEAGEELE